jgi:cbb3-type cytochrome oxidase cytochrome c subunit
MHSSSLKENDHYYDVRKLHLLFALAAFLLLVVTIIVVAADYHRPWKKCQRVYREELRPWLEAIAAFDRQLRATRAGGNPQSGVSPTARFVRPEGKGRWQRWLFGGPFLEPFTRRVRVEEVRPEGIPLDLHFQRVERIDRCTTCHQGMSAQEAAADWPIDRGPQRNLLVVLQPEERHALPGFSKNWGRGEPVAPESALEELLGLYLAEGWPLGQEQVIVVGVLPESLAARAGFVAGDRLEQVEGRRPKSAREAAEGILGQLSRKQTVRVRIQRGLPQPFAAHPRPELFVDPDSPHPVEKFGCTVCHRGNGAATSFGFAGHTPRDFHQRDRWQAQRSWRPAEDWPWPMLPGELVEASCLQCHHNPAELATQLVGGGSSAPILVEGYRLVRQLGCFGCHELKGTDVFGRKIGPDLSPEPPICEVAGALSETPGLPAAAQRLAAQLRREFWDDSLRAELSDWLEQWHSEGSPDEAREGLPSDEQLLREEPGQPGLGKPATRRAGGIPDSYRIWRGILSPSQGQDIEAAGLPKVGPSLRYAAEKLSRQFIVDYLKNPRNYWSRAKMPRFFGLLEHLSPEEQVKAREWEEAEIWAIAAYLVPEARDNVSAEKDLLGGTSPRQGRETQKPTAGPISGDPEKGALHFRRQGCLACHSHSGSGDFPPTDFAPDLTRLAGKLRRETAARWLRQWIEDPAQFWPRTPMPQIRWKLVRAEDEGAGSGSEPGEASVGQPARENADPVADLIAFLLQRVDWQPSQSAAPSDSALDELLRLYLADYLGAEKAQRFVPAGIPAEELAAYPAELVELVAPLDRRRKLQWLGRQSLQRRGCNGCHEIPGLEAAPAIGPALTGWGEKSPLLLDFGEPGLANTIFKGADTGLQAAKDPTTRSGKPDDTSVGAGAGQRAKVLEQREPHTGNSDQTAGEVSEALLRDKAAGVSLADESFWHEAFSSRQLAGFAWQKLRSPRSFDFGRTAIKPYTAWLRMPQFNLSPRERLAIVAFLLGLSRQEFAPQVQPKLSADQRVFGEGVLLLERLGCGQCHVLDWQRWLVQYDPGKLEVLPPEPDFDFVRPRLREGFFGMPSEKSPLGQAELWGMPELDAEGQPVREEEPGESPRYFVNLWEAVPVRVGNESTFWEPGGPQVEVSDPFGLVAAATRFPPSDSPLDPQNAYFARLEFPTLAGPGLLPMGIGPAWWMQQAVDSQNHWEGTESAQRRPVLASAVVGLLPAVIGVRAEIGGRLGRLLLPEVAEELRGSPSDAWSLLPPSLVRQGEMTRPEWTAGYLKDPYEIRPSVLLQMPRYHLPSIEAEKLAEFFQVLADWRRNSSPAWYRRPLSGRDQPTEGGPRRGQAVRPKQPPDERGQSGKLEPDKRVENKTDLWAGLRSTVAVGSKTSAEVMARREQAFRLILDRTTYCAKCHLIGDYSPSLHGTVALGPRLDRVAGRLKEEYLWRWIANPRRIIPYTGMPVNFPPEGPPLGQDILPGAPIDQLEAVVDLLSAFPEFVRSRLKIGLPEPIGGNN